MRCGEICTFIDSVHWQMTTKSAGGLRPGGVYCAIVPQRAKPAFGPPRNVAESTLTPLVEMYHINDASFGASIQVVEDTFGIVPIMGGKCFDEYSLELPLLHFMISFHVLAVYRIDDTAR